MYVTLEERLVRGLVSYTASKYQRSKKSDFKLIECCGNLLTQANASAEPHLQGKLYNNIEIGALLSPTHTTGGKIFSLTLSIDFILDEGAFLSLLSAGKRG